MKKKSEALPIFIDLITFLKKQYDIKVFIFYNNFGELNLAAVKVYLLRKRLNRRYLSPIHKNKTA